MAETQLAEDGFAPYGRSRDGRRQVLALGYILAAQRQTLPCQIHTSRIHVEIRRGKTARLEVEHLVLVERLVTVDVAALQRELQLAAAEYVAQRDAQIAAAHPRIGIVGIETRTAVQGLQLHVVAEAIAAADTFERIVEAQLAILEAAEDKAVAELVEDIAHQHREVVVLPLNILRRQVELVRTGLLTDLVSLQCGQIGIGLQAGGKAAVVVVYFQIVVRSELVIGSRAGITQTAVVDIIDRVGLEAAGKLAVAQTDLCTGRRNGTCGKSRKNNSFHGYLRLEISITLSSSCCSLPGV